MSEQITSADELDALPTNTPCPHCGSGASWRRTMPTTTGRPVRLCTVCNRVSLDEDWIPRPDQPQRVQPSREDVVAALKGVWFNLSGEFLGRFADAVLTLFADRPTVAEVKAEALREAADDMEATALSVVMVSSGSMAAGFLRSRADRIEREARP